MTMPTDDRAERAGDALERWTPHEMVRVGPGEFNEYRYVCVNCGCYALTKKGNQPCARTTEEERHGK